MSSEAASATYGWHTLKAPDRQRGRLTTGPDDALYLKMQVRRAKDGSIGYRFYEEWDERQGKWMCLCLDKDRNIVGQTFSRLKKDARRAMQAIFDAKGLGPSGLTI
jgi:hypothetical protein